MPWGSGVAECPPPTEGLCRCSLPAAFSLSPLAGWQQGEARLLRTGLFPSRVTPRPQFAPAQPPSVLAPGEVVESGPSPNQQVLGAYFCTSDLRGDAVWREGQPDPTQPDSGVLWVLQAWLPLPARAQGSLSSLGTELDGRIL